MVPDIFGDAYLVDSETGDSGLARYVTDEPNPERFRLFRLCDCPTCEGKGKAWELVDGVYGGILRRCSDCRGEGRVRQELATCATPEAVGVAIVTLAREGEWDECPLGLLDSEGEKGRKWLVTPWLPSARNVTDAARTLAKSKKTSRAE
jgi:hypothetical protein